MLALQCVTEIFYLYIVPLSIWLKNMNSRAEPVALKTNSKATCNMDKWGKISFQNVFISASMLKAI